MKIAALCLLVALFIAKTTARPTFDVIADIIHDLVHDPNLPPNHGTIQYLHNSGYTQNGYNQPAFTHGGYGYNQRPHQAGSGGLYINNSPNDYYPNYPYGGYYPPTGTRKYGTNVVYDNQGYYRGPPYATNGPNHYNYNNVQYGLKEIIRD